MSARAPRALIWLAFGACAGPTFEEANGGQPGSAGSGAGTSTGGAGSGGVAGTAAGSAGRGGSGAKGGAGGTLSGTGGAAGSAASAGTGGSDGPSGAGGDAGLGAAGTGSDCSCATGQYCRAGDCYDCADLSQLDFAPPELILDHPTQGLRFPRPGDVPGSLFFTLSAGVVGELWYMASIDAPPGGPLTGDAMLGRSGLFYLDDPGTFGFDVLFDQGDTSKRVIYTGSFAGGALSNVLEAPAPLAGSAGNFSAALASRTGRVYFMTTRDGPPSLRTGILDSDQADPVDIVVGRQSATPCTLSAADESPWVNPEGTLLAVSVVPLDGACNPVDADGTDLYVVPLSSQTGQPVASAVALAGVNVTGGSSSETDPAFTPDLCTLYFASDGGDSRAFDYQLFRADRR